MIRQAHPSDAQLIAPLIISAMGGLEAKFANSKDHHLQINLFEQFISLKDNQYSYQNILVWQEDEVVAGMVMAYDGGRLDELRKPFLDYTRSVLGFKGTPEDETRAGELYIDCLAVNDAHRGKGIARKLLKALTDQAKEQAYPAVGLLVSKSNDKAKRLYESVGFKVQKEIILLGETHYHLQYGLH